MSAVRDWTLGQRRVLEGVELTAYSPHKAAPDGSTVRRAGPVATVVAPTTPEAIALILPELAKLEGQP